MKEFKIVNFAKEYPGQPFPWFRTLTADEAQQIRQRFTQKLGLPNDIDPLVLTKQLFDKTVPCGGPNAEDDDFRLQETMARIGITPPTMVYVNWYRYDQIDEFYFADIAQHFDDIWYPGPDDIELFDSTFSWVVAIPHYGVVQWCKLEGP